MTDGWLLRVNQDYADKGSVPHKVSENDFDDDDGDCNKNEGRTKILTVKKTQENIYVFRLFTGICKKLTSIFILRKQESNQN